MSCVLALMLHERRQLRVQLQETLCERVAKHETLAVTVLVPVAEFVRDLLRSQDREAVRVADPDIVSTRLPLAVGVPLVGLALRDADGAVSERLPV